MSPMRRVNMYVEPEQWQALEMLADRSGAPVAELIRRAIADYVKQHLSAHELQTLLKGGGAQTGNRKRRKREPFGGSK